MTLIFRLFRSLWLASCAAGLAWGQAGGYSGPAILSRTGSSPGRSNGEPVSFRIYGTTSGFVSGGLTPVATDREGKSFDDKATGASAGFGFYGVQASRRSTTGISYGGQYHKS